MMPNRVFGANLVSGRLMPIFSNIGIGIVVFLIGCELFNSKRTALLSSTIYLFSPLSILWSPIVKTELPETLMASIGMLLLLNFITSQNEKFGIIFLSGFFFSIAYYIRRSAIVFILISLFIVFYFYKSDIYKASKTYAGVLLGYFSVVLIISLYFSAFMGFSATSKSSLNPLTTVIEPIQKITKIAESSTGQETIENNDFRLDDQPYKATIWEWKMTLKLTSFLLISLALSIIIFLYYSTKRDYNPTFKEIQMPYLYIYIWFFTLFLFYFYYTIQRGFYNQYFGELIPPLSLITAHFVYFKSNKHFKNKLKNIALIILFASFMTSFFYVSPSFGSIWSPTTLQEITHYLTMNSNQNDEIMSGAVIWAFESNSRLFLNITHPLSLRPGISNDERLKVENKFSRDPPRIIILDGYTEQTFIRHIPTIQKFINESYSLKKKNTGSKYPVKVFELNSVGTS
jgi:4-amino-4-deoxy-L-arabinose transferase-like glycosyltransferase